MDRKRIQCLLNAFQHIPIYLQQFPSNSSSKNPKVAILASPGFAPGTIVVNVTWIEREFNAGQTPRSIYPSIFNRFPILKAVKSKVRNFSTFFARFGLPWVRPWDYRGKFHMDRKRIQCLLNASQHVPIYLQPFLRYSEISVASDWFLTVFVSE